MLFSVVSSYQPGKKFQQRVRRLLERLRFHFRRLPETMSRVKTQVKPYLRLVTSHHIEDGVPARALVLVQNESTVCRPQDAIGAGDGVEHILRSLLAGVVNEQQGDAALV